ncbi:MAG: hypothetical protein MRQ13_00280 [Candidatus Midichloria sp.]|nr:hypothetical protein [Candidatus Midichloria sp.]
MKIITRVGYLIFIAKLILIESFAIDNVQDSILIKDCIITLQIWSLEAPTKFATSSELRKQTGSSVFAQGQSIIISGTILDQNCVPITGANVKIWQKNLDKLSVNIFAIHRNRLPKASAHFLYYDNFLHE